MEPTQPPLHFNVPPCIKYVGNVLAEWRFKRCCSTRFHSLTLSPSKFRYLNACKTLHTIQSPGYSRRPYASTYGKTTLQTPLLGWIRTKLSIVMLSSVVSDANFAPLCCLKNKAVAIRSSIIAKCLSNSVSVVLCPTSRSTHLPIQTLEPAPKGHQAVLAISDFVDEPSGSQRV